MKKIVFYLFLSLSSYLNAQQELTQIEAKLDSIFGHYNIGEQPGVSIAIIEKNKAPFFKSYGYANLEYQIKNTSNTLFNATDLAKQITVFSIMLLQDNGKLSINDDIKKHLPVLNQWPFKITLKHLMEQTSGLRDVMELKKWIRYQNGDVVTKQDVIDIAAEQRHQNFPSGSKFEYNRTGFVLLTEVIAVVSGMPFSEFVDQNIFTPLKMSNSVFVNGHNELIQNRSYPYDTIDDKFIKIANNSSFVGGTNLYTSTSDYAKWLQNMSNHSLGKSSFYEYLHTKTKLSDGQISNYTPGIFKDDSRGYWRIHLEGFDHGYTGYMAHIPEHNFSLVYFSNDINFPIDDIYDPIYDWFTSDYKIPPVKASVAPSVKFVNKSTSELQCYTGNYLFEDNFSIRNMVLENDTLFYVRDKNNRNSMVPIEGDHTFKMLIPGNDNIRVIFNNQGTNLEFRNINTNGYSDFVTIGRKFKFRKQNHKAFSSVFRNEALGHTIMMRNINDEMQLIFQGTSIILNQIDDDAFLAQANPKVKYVRIQRDEVQNVIGVFLSNGQINNLHYKLIDKKLH